MHASQSCCLALPVYYYAAMALSVSSSDLEDERDPVALYGGRYVTIFIRICGLDSLGGPLHAVTQVSCVRATWARGDR